MSNPPKAKGTRNETRIRKLYEDKLGCGGITRTPPASPAFDLDVRGMRVEAKKRTAWRVKEWVRDVHREADGEPWVLHISEGDQRGKAAVPNLVVMTESQFLRIAELLDQGGCWPPREN